MYNPESVKRAVAEELKTPTLISYVRDETGRKVGVVVSRKTEDGKLALGYSLCKVKTDKFNKYYGIYKAIKRISLYPQFLKDPYIYDRLDPILPEFIVRASKYFHV